MACCFSGVRGQHWGGGVGGCSWGVACFGLKGFQHAARRKTQGPRKPEPRNGFTTPGVGGEGVAVGYWLGPMSSNAKYQPQQLQPGWKSELRSGCARHCAGRKGHYSAILLRSMPAPLCQKAQQLSAKFRIFNFFSKKFLTFVDFELEKNPQARVRTNRPQRGPGGGSEPPTPQKRCLLARVRRQGNPEGAPRGARRANQVRKENPKFKTDSIHIETV